MIEAMEALGLELGDERPVSLTGGLPFFGGPGNNYSMHGIASAVTAVQDGQYANVLVGALGGHVKACRRHLQSDTGCRRSEGARDAI